MRFEQPRVVRPVDTTDLSDLTTAKRTGPASWTSNGDLEIPFDRSLTTAEVDAVTLRLTTQDTTEEQLRKTLEAYLQLSAPTVAQNTAQIKALTRVVLRLLDKSTT